MSNEMKVINGEVLRALMNRASLTLAVAESLTCGNIQAALGSISGASTFFEGGLTAYNLRQKVNLLSVNEEHARAVNSVSQQVANEMATGARIKFSSTIGMGTTGYAEPYSEEKILTPHAYFSICKFDFTNNKDTILADGLIDGEGLNRVDMQLHVTEIVLSKLLEIVKKM